MMPAMRVVGLVVLGLLPLAACSRPETPRRTADELRAAIEDYRHAEPEATEERVAALFARLDADVAARRADVAEAPAASREPLARELAAVEQERRELQQAWVAARLARAGATAGDALRGFGETLGRGLEDAGRRLREALNEGAGRPAPPESQSSR